MPSLVLIDGGLGQLHAAAEALDPSASLRSRSPPSPKRKRSSTSTATKTSPSSSTAARRCCISPAHPRREPPLRHRLPPPAPRHARPQLRIAQHPRCWRAHPAAVCEHFGSLRSVKEADIAALTAVVPRKTADAIYNFFHPSDGARPFSLPYHQQSGPERLQCAPVSVHPAVPIRYCPRHAARKISENRSNL